MSFKERLKRVFTDTWGGSSEQIARERARPFEDYIRGRLRDGQVVTRLQWQIWERARRTNELYVNIFCCGLREREVFERFNGVESVPQKMVLALRRCRDVDEDSAGKWNELENDICGIEARRRH
jgi:hypothetical protein